MAWGQFGKTAVIDPYMNVVVGPMLLTTPGAMNQLDEFETMAMIEDRFSEVHRSEEHTSELQSLMRISYAVFCLKKNNKRQETFHLTTHLHTYKQLAYAQ